MAGYSSETTLRDETNALSQDEITAHAIMEGEIKPVEVGRQPTWI